MEHLKTEKILEFLSISELNEYTINLSKEVNTHLFACEQCRKLVSAMIDINQAFGDLRLEKKKNRENKIENLNKFVK